MPFAFEKLIVYQKALDLADRVFSVTCEFPRGYYFLRDQLNRAVVSISTNIAEGNERFTAKDRKYFFGIARGSVQECVPLMELAVRRNFIEREAHQTLCSDLQEISKMLSGLIKGVGDRE